jgi:hypothetical protein
MQTKLILCALILFTFGMKINAQQAPALEAREGTIEPFALGTIVFGNRDFTVLAVPHALEGANFIRASIESEQTLVCTRTGTLYAVTPAAHPENSLAADLLKHGFEQLPGEPFQLFGAQSADKALLFRKTLTAGETLQARKWIVFLAHGDLRLTRPKRDRHWAANDGETLFNGIRLPRVWPPRYTDPASDEPMETPYLDTPPAVILIDTGRQLFVDDFLIAETTLSRTFHTATKVEGNPVFTPTTPEELSASTTGERGQKAVCYLGHGGVFFDPAERLFKMWYTAGWRGPLALATSRDAVRWERAPVTPTNNVVLPASRAGGDNCVWFDALTTNASERIKLLADRGGLGHTLRVSPDSRTWSDDVPVGHAGDYCSFFFNPFRNVWVYSVKRGGARGRCRDYAESPLFLTEGAFNNSVYWCNADRLDEQDPEAGCAPQLYSLSAVAYESLLLGIFQIHLGPPNEVCDKGKFPKITELKLGFSRDGFHWQRPDRRAFIPATRKEGAWDRAYLHSTAGVCLVDGDRLLFPYCGYSGIAPDGSRGMYTGASVGLATLRRDGFASLDADAKGGTLTTRPVTFTGKHLFVNAACPQGALSVEILDAASSQVLLPPFTASALDSTRHPLGDVSAFANRPVRFRFRLTRGSLYAFWVSPSSTGASRGYLAAGGPNHTGIIDTP